MNSTSQSVTESSSRVYKSNLRIDHTEASNLHMRSEVMEQTRTKTQLPAFEKEGQPKEKPDTGPKQDQKFPEKSDEGEEKPIPDMAPPEQGDA